MHMRPLSRSDLKPANIMLTMENQIKLGDLGLGRYFTSQTLEAFSKVGTPLYMSAEVLQGSGYTFSADIWSLGCVLYELAMLKSPFKSDKVHICLSHSEFVCRNGTLGSSNCWYLCIFPVLRFATAGRESLRALSKDQEWSVHTDRRPLLGAAAFDD